MKINILIAVVLGGFLFFLFQMKRKEKIKLDAIKEKEKAEKREKRQKMNAAVNEFDFGSKVPSTPEKKIEKKIEKKTSAVKNRTTIPVKKKKEEPKKEIETALNFYEEMNNKILNKELFKNITTNKEEKLTSIRQNLLKVIIDYKDKNIDILPVNVYLTLSQLYYHLEMDPQALFVLRELGEQLNEKVSDEIVDGINELMSKIEETELSRDIIFEEEFIAYKV